MNDPNELPEGHVLVIGCAGIDVRGCPTAPLQQGAAAVGTIRFSLGGVARNIAENLVRLDVPTVLLTAVGDDTLGSLLLHASHAAGINVDHAARIPGERTGSHMALMTEQNEIASGVSDFAILNHIRPTLLLRNEALFETASMIVFDTTFPDETIQTIFNLADKYDVPVCAEPTSPALAGKLCNYLSKLYMIAPNRSETTAICGLPLVTEDTDTAIQAARHLVSLGTQIAIVTLGEQGLAYADSSGSGHIPAIRTHVVDSTGAGDALLAAVIFGLLNEVPLDEAMRLGVTAASLTLRSKEAVIPQLSQELLYDELVI